MREFFTEYAYIIHLPFEHVNIQQYLCFVCIVPVLYKPMNGIFLHKPYESTHIFWANGRNVNVPNETCLSNTRNYTNINKHYCVSTTVSAATDVLPGGAGVFFAVTSSRSECQYHHASLIAYAINSKVKTATTWDSCDHPRHSLC